MARPRPGDRGPEFHVGPLTRTDFVRYAGASGDFNPIHHDDDFARAAGMPSVMAHGMLSAGVLASFVTSWFGPGSVRRFKVRFRDPVWPGDVLSATGKVAAVEGDSVRVDLALSRQNGDVVVAGEAVVAAGQT